MKTKFIIIMTLVATMVASSYAQGRGSYRNYDRKKEYGKEWRGNYNREESRLGRSLTYEQRISINQIKQREYKASKPLISKLNKMESRHQSLVRKNKPNMNKINANLYEMEQIKGSLARIEAKARVDILSLLNKKQKQLYAEHEKRHRQSLYADRKHGRYSSSCVFYPL